MANINTISPDGGTTVYDIEDPTARSGVNSLTPRVGIVEGKVSTLEGQMLSVEDDLDSLGTASTKNSTSVVTSSSDLVESGAVYDAIKGSVGFVTTGKNLFDGKATSKTDQYGVTWTVDPTDNNVVTVSGTPTGVEAFRQFSDKVLPTGTYKFYGLSDTTNIAFNAIVLYQDNTVVRVISSLTTEGGEFEILSSDVYNRIGIEYKRGVNGTPCSGTIRTMITKATITNSAYEPYHESVEEYCASKQDVIDTVGWCSTVLDKGVLASANVNSEGTINNSTYSLAYFKVQAGKKYTVSNCNDFTDSNLVFAYFTDVPVLRAVSYNNSRTLIDRGTATSQTVTAPINGYIAIRMNDATNNIRFEEGEVVTQSVEDKKCDTSVIAPKENGSTASQAYAVGTHAIRNGAFITWKNAKAQGETINDASDYTSGDVASVLETPKKKVIDLGLLPNASSKNVSSGLSDVTVKSIYGMAIRGDGYKVPLPFAHPDSTQSIGIIYDSNNNIQVITGIDRSAWTGEVTIEYV